MLGRPVRGKDGLSCAVHRCLPPPPPPASLWCLLRRRSAVLSAWNGEALQQWVFALAHSAPCYL
jgi:hypothetical protein